MQMATKWSEIFLPVTKSSRKCLNKRFVPRTIKYRSNQMEPAFASTVYCTRQPVEHVLALAPPPSPLARQAEVWTPTPKSVVVNGEINIYITAKMFQFSITVCFPTSPPIYFTIVRLFSGIKRMWLSFLVSYKNQVQALYIHICIP